MGAEVELDVASDTRSLRIVRAGPADAIAGRRRAVALFALALAASCGQDGPSPAGGSSAAGSAVAEAARARDLLEESTPLPSRPETVALADAVAIAAHGGGRSAEGARLGMLAAD